jgi:hypothetical protein
VAGRLPPDPLGILGELPPHPHPHPRCQKRVVMTEPEPSEVAALYDAASRLSGPDLHELVTELTTLEHRQAYLEWADTGEDDSGNDEMLANENALG